MAFAMRWSAKPACRANVPSLAFVEHPGCREVVRGEQRNAHAHRSARHALRARVTGTLVPRKFTAMCPRGRSERDQAEQRQGPAQIMPYSITRSKPCTSAARTMTPCGSAIASSAPCCVSCAILPAATFSASQRSGVVSPMPEARAQDRTARLLGV